MIILFYFTMLFRFVLDCLFLVGMMQYHVSHLKEKKKDVLLFFYTDMQCLSLPSTHIRMGMGDRGGLLPMFIGEPWVALMPPPHLTLQNN
jgi:hypothetical protein